MFTSCGYFRGLTCPYFQSGLCERPYCHFRHVKERDTKGAVSSVSQTAFSTDTSESITSPSLPNDSYFQNLSKKTVCDQNYKDNDIDQSEKTSTGSTNDYSTADSTENANVDDDYIAFPAPNPSFQPVYKPTPKSEFIQRNLNDPLPAYCPTPIVELKQRKKTLPASLEYDPVSNYRYPINSEKEEAPIEPTYIPIKRSLSNDEAEFPSNKQLRLDEDNENQEPSEYILGEELGGSDEEEEDIDDAEFSDGDHNNDLTEKCETGNSFEEIFDTKSYSRDTVRDKDIETDQKPHKLKKFDFVSSILSKDSSGKKLENNKISRKSQQRLSCDKENSQSAKTIKDKSKVNDRHKSSSDTSKDQTFNNARKENNHTDNKDLKHKSSSSKSTSSSNQHSKTDKSSDKESVKHKSSHRPSSSTKSSSSKPSSSHSSSHHNKLGSVDSKTNKDHKQSSSSVKTSDSGNLSHKDKGRSKSSENSSHSSSAHNSERERSKSGHKSHEKTGSISDIHSFYKNGEKLSSSKICEKLNSKSGSSDYVRSNSQAGDKHQSRSKHSSGSSDKHHSSYKSNDKHHTGSSSKNNDKIFSSSNSNDKKHSSSRPSDKNHSSSKSSDKNHSSSSSKSVDKHHSRPTSKSSDKNSSKERHKSQSSSERSKDDKSPRNSSSFKLNGSNTSPRPSKSPRPSSSPRASTSPRTSKQNNENSGKTNNNKRYSIDDIHANLFGEDNSDASDISDEPEPVKEMSESEIFQYLDEDDFSDADTYEECLKIFNETKAKTPEKRKEKQQKPEKPAEDADIGKKRMAYDAASKLIKKPVEKVKTVLSPAQVMHNRIVAMQKRAMEAAAARKAELETITNKTTSTVAGPSMFGVNKKRLAHVTVAAAKTKTKAVTASKSEKRQAHAPTITNIKRPTVPAEFGSKVPTAIRQRYLNLIIDECLKFIKDEETAFKRGQEEEHTAYGRSSSKNIYLRMAVNTIKRLRSEAAAKLNSPKKVVANSQSHAATLGGKRAAQISFTVKRSGTQMFYGDFSGPELYNRLKKFVLSEEELITCNFPRTDPESSGSAKFNINLSKVKDVTLKEYEKVCNRCGKRFVVYPDCEYGSNEQCSFHWGKAWKRRVAGNIETRYTCCSGELGAIGCSVSRLHTYESNKYDNKTGYMKTLPTSPPIDGNYGVFAMDCEMVYTTGGMELARVTVIGSDQQPVYESLVKPDYPVIDPNTRFSGIEESDLENVTTTLRTVQAVLLSLFNDQTMLLGHSLESDLIAVKLIHNTVVDTSMVFPHRLGLPYKRALRNIMSDHLQKIIQNDVAGHDSHEDALACLELMQWKLKEVAKREHRRS